jgi:S-adenosylmethionine-diacylgycerolhomoserine-N-methlytransferase
MQSRIYDATRWSFLFGRKEVIRQVPLSGDTTGSIVEVGCGTGINLQYLAKRFPQASLTGLDVSGDMIQLSQKKNRSIQDRLTLLEQPYARGDSPVSNPADLFLFSYSLTMINPQWSELIEQAYADLRPGGYIAVVDFHDSKRGWFKRHMSNHHVRMDGHLQPFLNKHFSPVHDKVHQAYLGVWEYLVYVGKK